MAERLALSPVALRVLLRHADVRRPTRLRLDEYQAKRYKVNHMVQCQPALDRSFAALSDPTRRAILLQLGRKEASISELLEGFDMTLTGLKKHVQILEEAGLVATKKVGRVRHCRLGTKRLEDVTKWMTLYRNMLEERLDHLEAFLESTKEGKP